VSRARFLLRVTNADSALFDRVSRGHTPLLDRVLPALSLAANNSKLWWAVGAVLRLRGGRRGARAAIRGVASIALTSLICNQAIKRLVRRPRPSLRHVPAVRQLRIQPATTSFPSGHAASAAAFTVAVASELPKAGPPVGAMAASVAYSRVYVGVHYPLDVVVGAGLGAGIAFVLASQWPVLPKEPGQRVPSSERRSLEPRLAGRGVAVVVNAGAGGNGNGDLVQHLREQLPAARVLEVEDPSELESTLELVAERCEVLGICGGDGSAITAAKVALDHGRPLLVVPAGTLNHLARDLGFDSADHAMAAVESGSVGAIDVAEIDGRPFLNTASLGAYPAMLEARRVLAERIGRWPAHVVAIAKVLFTGRPLRIEIDGRPRRLWMIMVGNCRHEPVGVAPSWRPRLDDGKLDVRLFSGERRLARTRLILSALAGRLTRSPAYEQFEAAEIAVSCPQDGGIVLARDGELIEGHSSFSIRKRPGALTAYIGSAGN
jgi:diacylglycerol kinase family enzyme/membrane-associated phospholipid phosphatase